MRLTLELLPEIYSICRLPADAAIPPWTVTGPFVSITRTADELSIVCLREAVPPNVQAEPGWRCLRVAGRLDFTLVGVLAALVGPLAEAGLSIFVISTFDTDYLLIKSENLDQALKILRR